MFGLNFRSLAGTAVNFTAGLMKARYNTICSPLGLLGRNTMSLSQNSTLLMITREMNRNARRPKDANHGKRPVCNARRREKRGKIKSRAYREKIFGFW